VIGRPAEQLKGFEMKKVLFGLALLALVALFVGCATPEQKAQKLFEQGKYDEILAQYGNLPIATEAKNKLAEKLFNEGKFDEVLKTYPDSPSAPMAKGKIAEKMFNEGKYQDVIAGYADTEWAMKAKEALAKQAFDAIDKEKDKKKKIAGLEDIVKNYAGTQTAANAQQMLDDMNKHGKKVPPAKGPKTPTTKKAPVPGTKKVMKKK